MDDCIWKRYNYKLMNGKLKIAIIMEAGYGSLNSNNLNSEIINLGSKLYFHSELRPYPESQTLLPKELHCFCNGLKIVTKQIVKSYSYFPNMLITLRSIQFSDCDIQEEAFTAAAIEWASEAFQFKVPNYQVSFDSTQGRSGMYLFDFTGV